MKKVLCLSAMANRSSLNGKTTCDNESNSSRANLKPPPEEKSKAIFPNNPRAQELDTRFRKGLLSLTEVQELRQLIINDQNRFLDEIAREMADEMYS